MKSSNDLPLDAPNSSQTHTTTHQLRVKCPSVMQLYRPAILVVEDNLVNQTITVNQLEGLGYITDVAANGQEALDALGPISEWQGGPPPYQLIFMDCNMPVMDGYQATRRIRQLEAQAYAMCGQAPLGTDSCPTRPQSFPKIAIVALTANVMATDRIRAFSVGMDDYLTKPVTTNVLKQTVERWLPGASSLITTLTSITTSPLATVNPSQPFASKPFYISGALQSGNNSMQHLHQTKSETEEPNLSHLDWSYLHSLSDSDHEFEMTLLELFLHDCQEQLQQLREAIAQPNIKQIEKISHYIKGASANVGAQYMQHYAHQIETQVRHTQLFCFDTELRRLETSFSIVQDMFAAQR